MLVFSVVIYGYGAAAEVHVFAYIAVSHISQVRAFRAFAKCGVFDLYKVSDMHMLTHNAVCADSYKRAAVRAVFDLAVRNLGIVQFHAVSYF